MTEEEAIKFLAAKMGFMQLLCGSANYRIMVDMGNPLSDEHIPFFDVAVYGKTPDEVVKNAVIMKFGEGFMEVASALKQAEAISTTGFGRIMEKRFPESLVPDGYYDRLLELCHTGKKSKQF